MNIRIELIFEQEKIPMDYRSFILSLIKNTLEEYDKDLYLSLYENDNPIMKTYTFSVFLGDATFGKDYIHLRDKKIILHISDYNLKNALHLQNALRMQVTKKKKYPVAGNSFMITNLYSSVEKDQKDNTLVVKMLSPLLVRYHQKGEKDCYYTFNDPEFKETLKMNIQNVIQKFELPFSLDDFDIVPLKNKKTVIKLYQSSRSASLGIFKLQGNPELLDFLTKAGMGSLRSSGFGHFKIIG